MSKADAAWAIIEDIAAGLPLPAQLTEAIAKAKRDYFGSDHHQLLMRLLKSLIAGEKVDMKADDLSQLVSESWRMFWLSRRRRSTWPRSTRRRSARARCACSLSSWGCWSSP